MPPPHTLSLFVAVTLAVLLVPGPSVLFVLTLSLQQGRRAGLWAVLGLETGLFVHVLAAALGISAVLASSPAALTTLRLGGAAYLLLLGARQLLSRAPTGDVDGPPRARGAGRIYRDGVLVDLLNPKTVLFFVALMPQFVAPDRGPVGGQALVLGLVVVALALVCDGAYALGAGALRSRWGRSAGVRTASQASGVTLVGLAVLAAVG